jgi:hypothetical protein
VDLVDVRVSADDRPLLSRVDGKAVPMNPGAHVLHFEGPGGVTLDRQVVVREGQKDQPVAVVLGLPAAAVVVVPRPVTPPAPLPLVETPPPVPAPTGSAAPAGAGHSRRVLGLAIGGVGVGGLAIGAIFGALASSSWSSVTTQCPTFKGCSSAVGNDRDSAATSATVSTVGFIAGGVLAATGLTLFLTAPKDTAKAGAVGLEVGPGALLVRGGF